MFSIYMGTTNELTKRFIGIASSSVLLHFREWIFYRIIFHFFTGFSKTYFNDVVLLKTYRTVCSHIDLELLLETFF